MFKATKILMLLWLFFCGGIGLISVIGGGAASANAMEENSVEQIMAENPEMTREQAQDYAAASDAGAVLGGGIVAGMGIVGAGMLWFVGMLPLLVMYLVFKPSGTNIQVQQVVGSMPTSQSSIQNDD